MRAAAAADVTEVVGAPPGNAPLPESVVTPTMPVIEPPDTVERAHRALAEVRRWMDEPPVRDEVGRPRSRRAAAAARATAPPLSIGTIEVTVEAAPSPRPVPAAPPPPPPRRAGRDVVPRDYLRGW